MTDTPTAPTSPDRLEPTEAANRLYDELAESPLPGARYAYSVVRRRLPAIEAEARAPLEAEVNRLLETLRDLRDLIAFDEARRAALSPAAPETRGEAE